MRKRSANVAAAMFYLCESATTATTMFICAKAKRQRQMFYLCESATTATMFYLCESATTATTNVLSARKRSVSGKCFICSESKATAQSAQSERKSITRYANKYF
ncbi:hypothetical protein [Lysinibacillus xylanilyticus]|uniref:hypothetical protein n=1 Tax=Lysinibacillus xylanilyticus TaxID=582475 RepID=UPI00083C9B62|nr:hypothetical protein [Lysinibacillus xylanilyticus]